MSILKVDWRAQSPSSINAFDTCPYKYKASYVTKEAVWKETEANMYGNRFHKAAEDAITFNMDLTGEFEKFQPVIEQVRDLPGRAMAEQSLAVNKDWEPTTWSKRHLGCKIDVMNLTTPHKVHIIDWKTGKPYPDYTQLDINALLVFLQYPEVEHVQAAYYYLKHDKLDQRSYERDGLDHLAGEIQHKVFRIEKAHELDAFMPSPNGLCKQYCDAYSCEHNGRNPDGTYRD